jgi:hypothetical protein
MMFCLFAKGLQTLDLFVSFTAQAAFPLPPLAKERKKEKEKRSSSRVPKRRLVQAEGGPHGGLDVEGLDVLPVLLQERHEEVDGHLRVDEQLALGHLDVADGDGEAENLLQLELDPFVAVHVGFVKSKYWKPGDHIQGRVKG